MRASREWTAILSEQSDDPRFVDLPDDSARLFYWILLTQVDAWGRARGDVRWLHSTCWPIVGTVEKTELALRACIEHRLVELYQVQGEVFVHVPDWDFLGGRVGKKDHRKRSLYPAPTGQASLALLVDARNSETGPVRPERAGAGQAGPDRATSGHGGPGLARAISSPLSSLPELNSLSDSHSPCTEAKTRSRARAPGGAREGSRQQTARLRRELESHWNACWASDRRSTFTGWTAAHRSALVGKVRDMGLAGVPEAIAVRELKRRIDAAIRDEDPFVRRRLAPIFFLSQWVRWESGALPEFANVVRTLAESSARKGA